MVVVDEDGVEMIVEAREIPPGGLAAYRVFWRVLKRNADERGIDIPPPLRNAIRNAWRNGYWAGRETS